MVNQPQDKKTQKIIDYHKELAEKSPLLFIPRNKRSKTYSDKITNTLAPLLDPQQPSKNNSKRKNFKISCSEALINATLNQMENEYNDHVSTLQAKQGELAPFQNNYLENKIKSIKTNLDSFKNLLNK